MAKTVHKRRNYFTKKKLQLRYTLSIVLTLLAVMLVSGFGLYMGMWGSIVENFSAFNVSEDLETAKRIAGYEEARFQKGDFRLERIFREAELLSEKERLTLNNALKSVNASLAPKILILVLAIFIGGIFISHRIAGPLYALEESARAIRNGDLKVRFRIRKGDQIKETAAALEQMAESLHRDVEKIKTAADNLKKDMSELTKHIPLEKDAQRLKESVEKIDRLLSKYRT